MQSMHFISIYVVVLLPKWAPDVLFYYGVYVKGLRRQKAVRLLLFMEKTPASWSRCRNEKRKRREIEKMHRGAAKKVLLYHCPRRTFSWSGLRAAASVQRIKGMIKYYILSLPLSSVLCCVHCHGNVCLPPPVCWALAPYVCPCVIDILFTEEQV